MIRQAATSVTAGARQKSVAYLFSPFHSQFLAPHLLMAMSRSHVQRLEDTLNNLVQIRTNMQNILNKITETKSELDQKIAKAKRNDTTPSPAKQMLDNIRDETGQMSKFLDQIQVDNSGLKTAVAVELNGLLEKSLQQKDRIATAGTELTNVAVAASSDEHVEEVIVPMVEDEAHEKGEDEEQYDHDEEEEEDDDDEEAGGESTGEVEDTDVHEEPQNVD